MQHLAIDQYGTHYHLGPHPRKELMERFCRKHVNKMYRDGKDGQAVHVGYVIANLWLTVYKIQPFKETDNGKTTH